MWLLFTGLLGPTSDRRYSFWGSDHSHRGSSAGGGGGGAGSWLMGYDFGPRWGGGGGRYGSPSGRGGRTGPQSERRRGWLL